ncbi:MAG TPA: esterase-like activity of phytase family protein [Sphingomicrobium sp.]|nr:esterase-like activity of phytase family protein [Sphingomicrobium sp.]
MDTPRFTRLRFDDEVLATLPFPRRALRIVRGLGSGLTRAADGRLFAVGDRGPNLKVELAVESYGMDGVAQAKGSAKIMPALDVGPAVAELRLADDAVEVVQAILLTGEDGRPLSGLPTPGSANSRTEPALRPDGSPHTPDPGGIDSEGIAIAPDGSFWIGEEYGPSLLRVGPDGKVLSRWVPKGSETSFSGAPYPIDAVLPPIAAARQVNRGFEAIALSADGARLHLVFQSPLAHPDEQAHAAAQHVRLWTIDTATGVLLAQYLYPLDDPASFRRDVAKGDLQRSDIKVSELLCVGAELLLLLERGSETTKLYVANLDPSCALVDDHSSLETRPSVEELSAAGTLDLPVLRKQLLLSTDDHPEVSADLEGMVMLDRRTLLLVNDNDFGIEDVGTAFWRVDLPEPL